MKHIEDACWQDLADAIVLAAVEDWQVASTHLRRPSPETRKAAGVREECERFFRSKWFEALTGLDGQCFFANVKKGFINQRPSTRKYFNIRQ